MTSCALSLLRVLLLSTYSTSTSMYDTIFSCDHFKQRMKAVKPMFSFNSYATPLNFVNRFDYVLGLSFMLLFVMWPLFLSGWWYETGLTHLTEIMIKRQRRRRSGLTPEHNNWVEQRLLKSLLGELCVALLRRRSGVTETSVLLLKCGL